MKAFMYVALAYFQKIIHDRPKLLEKDLIMDSITNENYLLCKRYDGPK